MVVEGKQVFLVTGVGAPLGERLARALADQPEYHVIGLDTDLPAEPIPAMQFIQADIRNPLLVNLFKAEQVDIVCHLAFQPSLRPSETAFDFNVMGTLKVFGACAQAGVRKILWASSTAVYGAQSHNSAYLTEQHPLAGSRSYGLTRDLVEIEAFCNGFRQQNPSIQLTILRFANIIGPTVDSPMTRFLSERLTPNLLGFDPMLQFIHEDDVVAALFHAATRDCPGVFNVAAPDHLPLSKAMGLAGKRRLPVFHLFAYWGYGLAGSSGLRLSRHLPIELDYIRYRWVADLQRMQQELDFSPVVPAEDALRAFGEARRSGQIAPGALIRTGDLDQLREVVNQRLQQFRPGNPFEEDGEDLDV